MIDPCQHTSPNLDKSVLVNHSLETVKTQLPEEGLISSTLRIALPLVGSVTEGGGTDGN